MEHTFKRLAQKHFLKLSLLCSMKSHALIWNNFSSQVFKSFSQAFCCHFVADYVKDWNDILEEQKRKKWTETFRLIPLERIVEHVKIHEKTFAVAGQGLLSRWTRTRPAVNSGKSPNSYRTAYLFIHYCLMLSYSWVFKSILFSSFWVSFPFSAVWCSWGIYKFELLNDWSDPLLCAVRTKKVKDRENIFPHFLFKCFVP